jgi:hypothetical protein
VVSKATSVSTLVLSPGTPQTYGTPVTADCSDTNPEAGAVLYRDGKDVTSENHLPVVLSAGDHVYECNVTSTQNYTFSTSGQGTYHVDPGSNSLALSLLPGSTVAQGTQTNVTGIGCVSQLTCVLTRNGVVVSNWDANRCKFGKNVTTPSGGTGPGNDVVSSCIFDTVLGQCVNGQQTATTIGKLTAGNDPSCKNETITIPCGRKVLDLPFFGLLQFTISLLGIALIYSLFSRKLLSR